MLRLRLCILVLAASGALIVAPACSSKKSSGDSSSAKTKKKPASDGGDDGQTSTKTSKTTDCGVGLALDDDDSGYVDMELDDASTTPCTNTNTDTSTGTAIAPDSDFYDSVLFNPPELADCHKQGLVYVRCTKTCSKAKTPASFKCDKAGIEAQFAKVDGFQADFDNYMKQNYVIDQCGVTPEGKPLVWLMCPNKGDGMCVKEGDLDVNTAQIDNHRINTGTFAAECDATTP